RVARLDEGLAHQHGVVAGVGHSARVVGPEYARLGNGGRHAFEQRGDLLGGGEIDVERVEITIVDTDEGGAGVDGSRRLLGGVHLDQSVETGVGGGLDETAELAVVEGGDDQEHRGGAQRPRLPDLDRLEGEVFAQHR